MNGGDKDIRKLFVVLAGAASFFTWRLYKCFRRPRNNTQRCPPPEAEEQAYLTLTIVDGLSAGCVFQFSEADTVNVGRRPENSVILSDTGISGSHCEFCYNPDDKAWVLTDMGSLNGTFLNRVLIASEQRTKSEGRHMKSGDRVQIGEQTTIEVACFPSWHADEPRATSDTITQVLVALLEQNPLDAEITESITPFEYAPFRITGCHIQKTGARARASGRCEDTCEFHLPLNNSAACALCLCDGHCGAETSVSIQEKLADTLLRHLPAGKTHLAASRSIKDNLFDTFLDIDGEVEGRDGATMSLIVIDGDEDGNVSIQAANVGDSSIVCADFQQMMKMHLTDSHRVTAPDELERLRAAGSLLTHNGTRVMGLNLSRSIGDKALKELNSGFLAEPYVSTVVRVEAKDSLLLIMASDGLWDVTNADLVMRIAHRILATHPRNLDLLCRCLMYHAISRRSLDDITIMVTLIGDSRGVPEEYAAATARV